MVAQARIELATPRSSGECSTTELPGQKLWRKKRSFYFWRYETCQRSNQHHSNKEFPTCKDRFLR